MSVVSVLRALSQLTLFSAICLLGIGSIVAGVNAANIRTVPLCTHSACTVVHDHQADGLTNPDHIKAVARALWS